MSHVVGYESRGLADEYGDQFGVQRNLIHARGNVVFAGADTGVITPFGDRVERPVLLAAAEALTVASQSAADAAAGTGARSIEIEYLDANYVTQVETFVPTGVTVLTTAAAMLRINAMEVRAAGTGKVNAGVITMSRDAGAAAVTLIDVTKANPGVATKIAHGFVTGDVILVTAMTEMTELNNRVFEVDRINDDTFNFQAFDGVDLDTSGFGTAATTGGTADKHDLVAMIDVEADQGGDGVAMQSQYTVPAGKVLSIQRWVGWSTVATIVKLSLVVEDEDGVRNVIDRTYGAVAHVSGDNQSPRAPHLVDEKTDVYILGTVAAAATLAATFEGLLRPKRGA